MKLGGISSQIDNGRQIDNYKCIDSALLVAILLPVCCNIVLFVCLETDSYCVPGADIKLKILPPLPPRSGNL